jgi:SAM-dependent methyltransferase
LLDDRKAARGLTRGDLQMTVCWSCGFVFNAAFDPTLLNYGAAYENTQTHSPAFARYVDELVQHLVTNRGLRNGTIVEIGCGKGGFLKKLVEPEEWNNQGVGYDPSYLGPERLCADRLRFRRTFYDETNREPADAVICRHVIEHIDAPVGLLKSVRAALNDSPQAQIFFETPCVEWILRHQVVWDFFYEHCSLFTAKSLSIAFERAGFRVTGCRHVFGGQYLWLESRPASSAASLAHEAAEIVSLARRFAAAESRLRGNWDSALDSLSRRGPVALWGAGAKGVTFANLLDPNSERIACVVDVNPAKQGKFLAGTGTPIVAPEDLPSHAVRTVLVLNPNYRDEIQSRLTSLAEPITLVDLMQPKRAA